MKNIKKILISIAVCLSIATNVISFASCDMLANGGASSESESVESASDLEASVSEEPEDESSVSEEPEEDSSASEEPEEDSSVSEEPEESDSEEEENTEVDFSTLGHSHVWTDGVCEVCQTELIKRDGRYIYFGEYPQSLKEDDVRVAEEASENGYYVGEDGAYYAKVVATPHTFEYVFANGDSVMTGETYYFKVEPIRWYVLTENSTEGTVKLLCNSVISAMSYQDDYYYNTSNNTYYTTANGAPAGTFANNYKYSAVRNWLLNEFYNTAFDETQQALMQTMFVDNSAATTIKETNPFTCENTNDKVTLLSFKDTINTAFGFQKYAITEDALRMLKTTDYARAIGAWTSTSGRFLGNGTWMLRSPHSEESSHVTQGERSGKTNVSVNMDIKDSGVAPVIMIKL